MRRCMIVLLVLSLSGILSSQTYQDRIDAIFAELDASEIEIEIERLCKQISSDLMQYQVTSIAIAPFYNSEDRRTGLSDYLADEISVKLQSNTALKVIPAKRLNQESLFAPAAPVFALERDGTSLAQKYGVDAIASGRTMTGAGKIVLRIELLDFRFHKQIKTFSAILPLTKPLLKLDQLSIIETQIKKLEEPPEIPAPIIIPDSPRQSAPEDQPNSIAAALHKLVNQLLASTGIPADAKIGVLEFVDAQGRITQLGRFLAEEITTQLFMKARFNLLERTLLNQVLKEHGLAQTGIIDLGKAQEIGKALGADAIITGSLIDTGDEIRVNARMVHVGLGTVLAAGAASIAKTADVARLNEPLPAPQPEPVPPLPQPEPVPPAQTAPVTTPSLPASTGYIYYEDFKNIQDGMLPAGWIGGEKLMVKSEGSQKFVTDFERDGLHRITIDNLVLPENFEMEYLFRFSGDAAATQIFCYVGNVKTTVDVYGWCQMNDTRANKEVDYRNKTIKTVLRKEGPLFKFFINGEEMLMARYPQFKTPQAISFEFQHMSGFRIQKIALKTL